MVGLRKFRLVSADAREGGTSNEALRVWEAMYYGSLCILLPVISAYQHNTNSKFEGDQFQFVPLSPLRQSEF